MRNTLLIITIGLLMACTKPKPVAFSGDWRIQKIINKGDTTTNDESTVYTIGKSGKLLEDGNESLFQFDGRIYKSKDGTVSISPILKSDTLYMRWEGEDMGIEFDWVMVRVK